MQMAVMNFGVTPILIAYNLGSSFFFLFFWTRWYRGDPGELSHKESWSTPISFKTNHSFDFFFLQ